MAYAIKYLFKFESSNGTTREIRVLQDGYTGEVIQRPLGRAPILKKQQNGPVHGTSLEFFAECNVDREFIEFYTSDPKAYRVDLYAGATLLWQGYITPELYSEPDIAPPYDVQVVATDGVGELKLYEYAAQGTVTLRTLLSGLLSRTGLGTDIYLISSLKPGSAGAGSLLEKTINLDYMAGESCYDVLTYLLDTLHATITWWKGAWILARETNVTFTNGKVRYFNTAGNSALLNDSVQVLGKMYANPAWPVGQLSTVIDPAKNRVTVQAPWHVVTCLRNSDMGSDSDWVKAKNARYETDGYVLPININTGTSETAVISQATSMSGLRVPMSLSVKATGATSEISAQVVGAVLGVLLTYKVGNVTYHLVKGDDGVPVWQQGDDIGTYIPLRTRIDFQQPLATWDSSRIEAEELTIDNIPPFLQGTTFPAGTLTVYILGYCAKIYGAYLDVVLPKGYQDILRISNGARGEGSEVEIAIGRETADNAYYAAFLQGLLLDSGNLITSFSDANFPGGMDYLAFIARDYALSVALPRAKVTGTVYLESGIAAPPLVFTKGALNYWLQTWSWNLYEDELEIEALTLPSASLTVESETILESTASASSSSGRTSGGGGSIAPGVSMAAVQEWVTGQGYLASVEAASTYATITALNGVSGRVTILEGRTNWDTYFGIDGDGNVYVKKNGNTARNFYSWGAVSAGGLSSGGGSEGVSLAAVWASLNTNSDDYANEKINAYHIPIGSGLSVVNGLIVANNAGTVTSVKVGTTTYNPTDGVVSLPAYPTSLPASDVYSWAKAETKPSYAFSEITGAASASQIPTLAISKVSGLQTALDGKQPLDADLTAIAGLTGTSGFLKKTAANTWALDTNTYLTGITSSMVTTALGYTPANSTALANYLPKTGGTIKNGLTTGPLILDTDSAIEIGIKFFTDGVQKGWAGYNTTYGIYLWDAASNKYLGIKDDGTPHYHGNTLWHAGNSNLATVNWAANQMTAQSFKLAAGAPTLTWDATNSAWHLSGNFYADGWISAGGVSSGGGTSGIDLGAMWASLTNSISDAYATTKIAAAHIPDMSGTYGYLKSGDISGVYLPLIGGTLSNASNNLLTLNNTASSPGGNYIKFQENGTKVAEFGYWNTTYGAYIQNHAGQTEHTLSLRNDGALYLDDYVVYHAGNANKNDISWTAYQITAWDSVYANRYQGAGYSAGGSIVINKGGDFWGMGPSSSNVSVFAMGTTTNNTGTWKNEVVTITDAGSMTLTGSLTATTLTSTVATGTAPLTVSSTTLVSNLNADLLDGQHGSYYATASSVTTLQGYFTNGAAKTARALSSLAADSTVWYDTEYPVIAQWDDNTHLRLKCLNAAGTVSYDVRVSAADKFVTARTLWGQTFDGQANVTGALSSVTNIDSLLYFDTTNSRVGVGVSSPSYAFHCAGDIATDTYLRINAWTGYGTGSATMWYNATNAYMELSTSLFATSARFGGANGVCIGRTYAGATANAYDLIERGQSGGVLYLQYNHAGGISMCYGGGNVAIGSFVQSGYKLYVNGGAYASSLTSPVASLGRAGGNGLYLNSQTSSGTGYYNGANIVLNAPGSYWRGIGYNGYSDTLTIGPCSDQNGTWAANASITLRVEGNIVATGAITAGAASDARLKTNIQSLSTESAKRIVMALNPVTFTWNEKATELYDQYKGDDLGMIAQEVEPYLPQAVGTIFESYKRLDYTKVISPLVKVAQDHESRIRQLEAENRELRKRLNMN